MPAYRNRRRNRREAHRDAGEGRQRAQAQRTNHTRASRGLRRLPMAHQVAGRRSLHDRSTSTIQLKKHVASIGRAPWLRVLARSVAAPSNRGASPARPNLKTRKNARAAKGKRALWLMTSGRWIGIFCEVTADVVAADFAHKLRGNYPIRAPPLLGCRRLPQHLTRSLFAEPSPRGSNNGRTRYSLRLPLASRR